MLFSSPLCLVEEQEGFAADSSWRSHVQHTATVPFDRIFLQVRRQVKENHVKRLGEAFRKITVNNYSTDVDCSCPPFAVYPRPNTRFRRSKWRNVTALTHFLSFLAVLSELALGFKENVNTQYSSVRKLSEVMHTLTNARAVRARRLNTGHHHRGQRKGYWRHLRINITPNQYTSLDLTLKLINIFTRLFQNSIFSLYGCKTYC